MNSKLNSTREYRRRADTPKKHNITNAKTPARRRLGLPGLARAAVPLEAVVLTVKVAVTAVLPVIATEAGTEHVGGTVALGPMLQDKLTVPVNPPEGAIVTTEVFPVVAPRVTVMPPLLVNEKDGAGA
jgi:hypothetical protein